MSATPIPLGEAPQQGGDGEVIVPMNKVIDRIHELYGKQIAQLVGQNAMTHAAMRVQEDRIRELEALLAAVLDPVQTAIPDGAGFPGEKTANPS